MAEDSEGQVECAVPEVHVVLDEDGVRGGPGATVKFVEGSWQLNAILEDAEMMSDDDLMRSVSQSLSFTGVENLSRAIPLSLVMTGCGSILSKPGGTFKTYNLSVCAQRIKYFISHNWSVSRIDKFMALALMFNFRTMSLITGTLLTLICILNWSGHAPVLQTHTGTEPEVGYLARILVVPGAFVALILGHDLGRLAGWTGPLMFLDKACIHQVDPELKLQGIDKLGAFLRISDRMIILYGDAYFRKLWTIYEVANFLALHKISQLDVMPVVLPRVFFAAIPLFFCSSMICLVLRSYYGQDWSLYVTYVFAASTYMVICRRWARHKSEIQHRLKSFEVRDCVCAVESDREVVYAKIADLMRISRRVDRNATVEESLTVFNEMVRTKMPAAFKTVFRSNMFSYSHRLFLSAILDLTLNVDSLLSVSSDFQQAVKSYSIALIWCFALIPLYLWGLEVCAAKSKHLRGCRETAWYVGILIALTVPFIGADVSLDEVETRPGDLTVWLAVALLALTLLVTAISVLCVRTRPSTTVAHIATQKVAEQAGRSASTWKHDQTTGEYAGTVLHSSV